MTDTRTLLAGYRRAARFLIPYRWRMVLILLTGVGASPFVRWPSRTSPNC